ncbi:hypothetical protein THTE_0690 [Thermogutta terrifontis]|uniref:HNH nuclease domain-containing protein n=1 Tax=Thermogutta terrifontis TaxID=1331910 RepID=A0A286RBF0_9BACT|nr:TerB family tellurite resistance protein [Thermogutta terrifontis]ASV73292.1 hypothetical protein THTE_0690 [Thermogutta terrifontis]MBC7076721.1 TerB family tellurite resistance protein [Synergistales bacterium]
MAKLAEWVKKTVQKLIDPDREKRVQELTRLLYHGLVTNQEKFSVSSMLQGWDVNPDELELAKENVYRYVLERAWADEVVTQKEQQALRSIVQCLEISEAKAKDIHLEFARNRFAIALGEAMEDGILSPEEEARLARIAHSVGYALPQFARMFFRDYAEAFLRGLFMAAVADGRLSPAEWENLLRITQKFGLTKQELQQAIQLSAQRFVEHVLADAKADGRLSPEEEKILRWLVEELGLSAEYRKYLEQEINILRRLEEIENGRLPTLSPPSGLQLRAGELLHFYSQAVWHLPRTRGGNLAWEQHHGNLALTDHRLLFSSSTKTVALDYRKIISHRGSDNWLEIQTEGKPVYRFDILQPSPLFYPLFTAAVGLANQTRVAKVEGKTSRYIPRDVRQRVWQRYGGRCAECGATDYLEFDHIIPVAKGGSNSDNNVQLLCRRCNLKKSDSI